VAYEEEAKALRLQLQALPYNGNHIKPNPSFANGELAVVVLASFPIDAEVFDGATAAGPVPIFVCGKPDEAIAALNSHPEHAHKICQVNMCKK
jgi:hypothetical protein